MKVFFLSGIGVLGLAFCPLVLSQEKPAPGRSQLKKVLQKYSLKPVRIPIHQEIFLSGIQSPIQSQGHLDIHKERFLLLLKGEPSSKMLFDGNILWYQPDLKEKLVFQIQSPSQIQMLSHFFNSESFFKNFKIKESIRKNQNDFFHFLPRQNKEALSDIFMKTSSYISEIRLVWRDLNNWQKYKLSRPTSQTFPKKHFQFSPLGFEVISQENFLSSSAIN